MTHPPATRDNTVFLTVCAFQNYESKTQAFRWTAELQQVPVTYCDAGAKWHGFYHHKIERMRPRLQELKEQGYQYAFILDSRDVIFIDPIDVILEKFNAINEGKMIFNTDVLGNVWPSHHAQLAYEMEQAMQSKYARLNAGAIAGSLDTLLTVQGHVMELHQELLEGRPRDGIHRQLFLERGTCHAGDDQHLYQICLTYYPELFQLDYQKRLFALLASYPSNMNEPADDPRRHDVVGTAAIVHGPWPSREASWNEWTFQYKWKRDPVPCNVKTEQESP